MKRLFILIMAAAPSLLFAGTMDLNLWQLNGMQKGIIAAPSKGSLNPFPLSANGTLPDKVLILIKGDPSAAQKWGAEIQSKTGGYFTAMVPLSAVENISAEPGIDAMMMGNQLTPLLDQARVVMNADSVHAAGYTGNDVIVGIVDTGIDIAHPDFLSDYGLTRILYLWDQNSSAGKSPQGFSYGTEWTKSDIDKGVCTEVDDGLHGTHVAGISAGNGAQSGGKYKGLAPSANIIFVSLNFYNSAAILDAINYILWRANQLGKPCVINLSIGYHNGSHMASDPYNAYVDQLLDYYGHEGKIIVWAAGNSGDDSIHVTNTIGKTFQCTNTINVQDNYAQLIFFYSNKGLVPFKLVNNSGTTVVSFTSNSNPYLNYYPYVQGMYSDDNIYMLQINLINVSKGNWRVIFASNAVDMNTVVHGYIANSYPKSAFFSAISNGTISTFAAQKDSISVAALASKTVVTNYLNAEYNEASLVLNDIAYFSSAGPSADGQNKPEICAPGALIVSTLANKAMPSPSSSKVNDYYFAMEGTSMAAPAVAGMIALLLEKEPTLTVDQVRSILINTAKGSSTYKTDPGTWDNRFGYGVANLLQFLSSEPSAPNMDVKVVNNVLNFSKATDCFTTVQFRANSSQINQSFTVKVYDQSGNLIKDLGEGIINGVEVINYDWYGIDNTGRKVCAGIYFIMVTAGAEVTRYPVLIVY